MTQNDEWSVTGRGSCHKTGKNKWPIQTNWHSPWVAWSCKKVGWVGSDGCCISLPNGWFYEWQVLPTHQFLFDKYLQISRQSPARSLDSAFQHWIWPPCMLGAQPGLQVHRFCKFLAKPAFPLLLDPGPGVQFYAISTYHYLSIPPPWWFAILS